MISLKVRLRGVPQKVVLPNLTGKVVSTKRTPILIALARQTYVTSPIQVKQINDVVNFGGLTLIEHQLVILLPCSFLVTPEVNLAFTDLHVPRLGLLPKERFWLSICRVI